MNTDSLFQILYKPLVVPMDSKSGKEPSPSVITISDRDLVLGFSTPLALAMMCGEGSEYLEMSAKELFPALAEAGLDFGYNFGQDDAVMYEAGQLEELLAQMDRDQIVDVPETLDFVEISAPKDLIETLEELAPHAGVISLVREKSLGLIICVSQAELDAHIHLLAQLHEVAVASRNEDNITLMPYKTGAELGVRFGEFALEIQPKVAHKHDNPPILR